MPACHLEPYGKQYSNVASATLLYQLYLQGVITDIKMNRLAKLGAKVLKETAKEGPGNYGNQFTANIL